MRRIKVLLVCAVFLMAGCKTLHHAVGQIATVGAIIAVDALFNHHYYHHDNYHGHNYHYHGHHGHSH